MTQSEEARRMLAGELYLASDPALVAARRRARSLMHRYNAMTEEHGAAEALLKELLGAMGSGVHIEPPFFCDYGSNIRLGQGVFMNFGCVILDCNLVTIGDGTLLGPGVHIYAATHPIDPATRLTGRELAFPVSVGANVWIGGGAIICPGVTIGDNCVIGAGSIVTKDLPAGSVAVGNPARIQKTLQ